MASMGPIGNAIYVNQLTANVASEKNAVQNRVELQNMAAANASNAKTKEIEEVRPTEEIHKIDPDREHHNQRAKEETPQEKEPQASLEEEEGREADSSSSETEPLHRRLDITV